MEDRGGGINLDEVFSPVENRGEDFFCVCICERKMCFIVGEICKGISMRNRRGGVVGNLCVYGIVGKCVGKGCETCGKELYPFP